MGRKISREQKKVVAFGVITVFLCCVIGMLAHGGFEAADTNLKDAEETAVSTADEKDDKATVVTNDEPHSAQISRVLLCMGEKEGDMFVSWQTDKDGPRVLKCAEDEKDLENAVPIRAQRVEMLRDMYRFKVKLTGLESGKKYWYEIGNLADQEGGEIEEAHGEGELRSFVVPETNGEINFVYLGDPQFDKSVKDYDAWGKLISEMYEKAPYVDFAIIGGDMVNLPTRKDHWSGFLDNCTVFEKLPVMTIPGNHEGVTSNNTYKKLFHNIGNGPEGEAFYYFDRGNCRFLMLDSSFLTKARKMAMGQTVWTEKEKEVENWLRKSLEESPARWNIVATHHPIYGMHDMFTVSKEIRELWLPILKEGGVDLVLCGHQHVYMRTKDIDGIVHIMGVSGAKRSKYYRGSNEPVYSRAIYGAGPNYQIIKASDDSLEITSYNEKGSIIDAARIDKGIKFPYFRTFW